MDELVKNLMEELNCDTAFTIPIFGGIPVAESVFVTWLIMAVVILLCAIFVRNLKVTNPGKGQLLLETAVSGIYSFFEDILGEKGKRFIPYLMSVGIYIGIANLVCHYGIAEDGRPGHPAGGIQLLLRYIRRADPGIRFCIPDRIIY